MKSLFALLLVAVALPALAQSGLKRTTTIYGYAQYAGGAAAVKLTTAPTSGIPLPTQRPDGTLG